MGVGAASLALPELAVGRAKSAQRKKESPNLLIIHTDQLSCWAVSIYAKQRTETANYGKVLVKTPNIDSLAQEGAIFYNFFTNSAVCTPSRGCLVTGRYPHSHGAYRNNIEMNRDEVTIAHILQRVGYETGYAGKWHLDGPPKPGWVRPERSMGFADCRFMFNRGHWKKIVERPQGNPEVSPYKVIGDEKTFTTDWLADKTIEFIKRPRTKPFFYMVSIPDPHGPFTVREPYMTMYRPEDMTVPNNFKQSPAGKGKKKTAGQMQKSKAQYCGLVKCIDDNVGRILQVLKDERILDDTIIVVQQTLLGLMGFKSCGREQGRDASGLLRGEKIKWTDEAMIHHSSLESAGIFTPEYELILKAKGNHMFFDRINDPEQIKNLYNNPDYRKVFNDLATRIIRYNIDINAPAVSWLNKIKIG